MNRADSGAYVLLLRLGRIRRLRIGALGVLTFKPGWYVYVGSALNGLSARVARHLRLRKRKRWHIDYLRPAAERVSAFLLPSRRDRECALARKLRRISNGQVAQFGSSDCACPSHLFYFSGGPARMVELRRLLRGSVPAHVEASVASAAASPSRVSTRS
jgi:sugar fermentation stimulation protein A